MTTARAVCLGLLLLCVASAAEGNSGFMRQPSCPNMEAGACPLNLAPVCGSNGVDYANECSLCVDIQEKGLNILIAKDGIC